MIKKLLIIYMFLTINAIATDNRRDFTLMYGGDWSDAMCNINLQRYIGSFQINQESDKTYMKTASGDAFKVGSYISTTDMTNGSDRQSWIEDSVIAWGGNREDVYWHFKDSTHHALGDDPGDTLYAPGLADKATTLQDTIDSRIHVYTINRLYINHADSNVMKADLLWHRKVFADSITDVSDAEDFIFGDNCSPRLYNYGEDPPYVTGGVVDEHPNDSLLAGKAVRDTFHWDGLNPFLTFLYDSLHGNASAWAWDNQPKEFCANVVQFYNFAYSRDDVINLNVADYLYNEFQPRLHTTTKGTYNDIRKYDSLATTKGKVFIHAPWYSNTWPPLDSIQYYTLCAFYVIQTDSSALYFQGDNYQGKEIVDGNDTLTWLAGSWDLNIGDEVAPQPDYSFDTGVDAIGSTYVVWSRKYYEATSGDTFLVLLMPKYNYGWPIGDSTRISVTLGAYYKKLNHDGTWTDNKTSDDIGQGQAGIYKFMFGSTGFGHNDLPGYEKPLPEEIASYQSWSEAWYTASGGEVVDSFIVYCRSPRTCCETEEIDSGKICLYYITGDTARAIAQTADTVFTGDTTLHWETLIPSSPITMVAGSTYAIGYKGINDNQLWIGYTDGAKGDEGLQPEVADMPTPFNEQYRRDDRKLILCYFTP